jgi:membrane-associated protease RseP (regulator of RpoE activity)
MQMMQGRPEVTMYWFPCILLRANAAFLAAVVLLLVLVANGVEAQERGRPRLGVNLRDLTPEAAYVLGVPFPGGLQVGAVFDGSPAKAAGMQPGDIIVMVDGRKVFDTPALMEGMARAEPGTPVRLSVLRAGGLMHLPVMPWGPPPAGPSNMPETRQAEAPHTQAAGKPWLGVSTESLAPEEAFELALEQPGAARVVNVTKGSPADEMGLMPGDVIIRLDDEPVLDSRELTASLAARQPGSRVRLLAFRRGEPLQVALTLAKRPEAGDAPKVAETQPAPSLSARLAEAEKRLRTASRREQAAKPPTTPAVPEAQPRAPQHAVEQAAIDSGTGQRLPESSQNSSREEMTGQRAPVQAAANASPERGDVPQPVAGAILSVAISPDGHRVLTGSTRGMKLWDIAARKELRSFDGGGGGGDVASVAFSPDGRFAISAVRRGGMKLWEVATGKEVRTFGGKDDDVTSVAYSPNGRSVLSGTYGGVIKLWDAASGKQLIEFRRQPDEVLALAFSPGGSFVISGSGNSSVKVWDAASGQELHSMNGHSGQVRSVAFSPDGLSAVSASWDGTVKAWDVNSGAEKRTFEGRISKGEKELFTSALFTPDGSKIVTAGVSGWVQVWDVATGKELRSFEGKAEGVSAMALSAGGKFAVMGGLIRESMDETLKFWDVAAGKELSVTGGRAEFVSMAAR